MTEPKARELELNVAAGVAPDPLRLSVCGLFEALSVILRLAVSPPVTDGAKVTLMLQELPDVTLAPEQVSEVLAKSAAFVPVMLTLETVRFAPPELVTVRD